MPKISKPRQSRWILFKLELKYSNNIHKQIIHSGAQDAQWCCVDDSVEGYMYFSTPRNIPLKKQWISCATFSFSTKEEIIDKYKDTNIIFNTHGDNPLLNVNVPVTGIKSFFSKNNDMPAVVATERSDGERTISEETVDSDVDEAEEARNYYKSIVVKFKSGIPLSMAEFKFKQSIEAVLLT